DLTSTGTARFAAGFSRDGKRIGWGDTSTQDTPTDRGPLQWQLRLPAASENLAAPEPITATGAAEFLRGRTTHHDPHRTHRPGGGYGYKEAILDVSRNGKVIVSIERGVTNGFGSRSYTFSPDGRTIISGGNAGKLYAYDVGEVEAAGGTLKDDDLRKFAH